MIQRRQTKQIFIGQTAIGGGAPITVQSMTNTDTRDAEATVRQIKGLEEAGCEIIRVAVPDMAAAEVLRSRERAAGAIRLSQSGQLPRPDRSPKQPAS
jgi:(E)-4-hydroxy-3-methylbut-2-enyl-diphosphate synthase